MDKIREYIDHWEISKILFVLLIGVILLFLVSPKRRTNRAPDLDSRLKIDTQTLDR